MLYEVITDMDGIIFDTERLACDVWRSVSGEAGFEMEYRLFFPAVITSYSIHYTKLYDSCGEDCRPGCHCGKYIEIWNDVFMQYSRNNFV